MYALPFQSVFVLRLALHAFVSDGNHADGPHPIGDAEQGLHDFLRRTALGVHPVTHLNPACPQPEVLGLEQERFWTYDGFRFKGYLDRVDSFLPGEVRVVDYKTGKVEDKDINIFDTNAADVVAKLFGSDNSGRPKIALQLFLYDMFVSSGLPQGASVSNSVYAPARMFVTPVQNVPASPVFVSLMKERLSDLLREISDVSVPFSRTSDTDTCSMCDFKMICGR